MWLGRWELPELAGLLGRSGGHRPRGLLAVTPAGRGTFLLLPEPGSRWWAVVAPRLRAVPGGASRGSSPQGSRPGEAWTRGRPRPPPNPQGLKFRRSPERVGGGARGEQR